MEAAQNSLRYALVHDWLVNHAGSEEVFQQVQELFPGHVFTSILTKEKFPWIDPESATVSYIDKLPLAHTKHYIYAPLASLVYPKFDLAQFDVVLSDSHSFAHGVVKRKDALHINYYHSPARSLWMPEIDPRAQGGLKSKLIPWLKKRDLDFSKRPDVIFANSQTTASRIEKFYGRKVDRVIYPPCRIDKFQTVTRRNESEGYLMWGRMVEYKRIDLAIEVAKQRGFKLHIVGGGPLEAELKAQAEGIANVQFHGKLPDEQLLDLMGQCRGVLFNAYEDFGIVPVEALAAGLPVVAFGVGGASESVTPECGVLFHEQTPEALSQAIAEFEAKEFDHKTLASQAQKFDVSVFRKEYADAVLQAQERAELR
ncbi:MAG: glycosyltransferase [Fimbriimonadaceae bacterium]|nr:glycosyltransferase [Fimbriimonadaceae bacterium]